MNRLLQEYRLVLWERKFRKRGIKAPDRERLRLWLEAYSHPNSMPKEETKCFVVAYIDGLMSGVGLAKDVSRPLNAEFLLYLFLSKKDSEAVAGDLEERWRKIKKKFGVHRANFWYWTQVIRSLWPFGLAAVKRVSGLLALLEKIGRAHV